MEDRPRDERELNAGLELHTPSWLPGGNAMVRYRRVWDKRLEQFANTVATSAGMSINDLEARALEADGVVDVLATAAERAQQRGDPEYRDTLAGLVAAALIDPARLDPVAYYVSRLVQLEPIHIRLLAALRQSTIEDTEDQATGRVRQVGRYNSGELVVDGRIHIDNAQSDKHGFDAGLLEACVKDLAGVGFAAEDNGSLRLTRLGMSAADEIERVRSEIVARG